MKELRMNKIKLTKLQFFISIYNFKTTYLLTKIQYEINLSYCFFFK